MYAVDDTIKAGPYKGFVVVGVSKGWYKVYHPNNVTPSCSKKEATTSIRWFWVWEKENHA